MLKRTIASLFILLSCGNDAASPPTEPPAQPIVTAAGGNGQIVLSWHDVANETHYRAEYFSTTGLSWILLQEVPANTTTATHTNATRNVNYSYRVTACNSAGCSSPGEASAKWTPPPEAPTLLSLTVDSIAQLRVEFTAQARSGGVPVTFMFSVKRPGEAAPFLTQQVTSEQFETGDPETVAIGRFITNALQPDTDYEVGVTASNTVGPSALIAPKTFRTKPAIAPTIINPRNGVVQTGGAAFIVNVAPNGLHAEVVFQLARMGDSFANPVATAHMLAPKESSVFLLWDTGMPGLVPTGQTYKWRVVATNQAGTTVSDSVVYTRP